MEHNTLIKYEFNSGSMQEVLTPKLKDNFLHNTSRYTPHFMWLMLNQNPDKKEKKNH